MNPLPLASRTRELALCLAANRIAHRRLAFLAFSLASRLGDGAFWYALMVVLPLVDGLAGLAVSLQLAGLGIATLVLYRAIKRATRRPRPCVAHPTIRAWVAPLDEFSFPSGHTLHAVAFTCVALAHYPDSGLALLLVSFTVLVALSRVVLGLHYPSDVLASVALGPMLAWGSCLVAGT